MAQGWIQDFGLKHGISLFMKFGGPPVGGGADP